MMAQKIYAKTKPYPIFVAPQYPFVGQEIACDVALIRQDDTKDGQATTPMTKIRYDVRKKKWKQVRPSESGMYVFFNNEPEVIHKSFRVTSIIPSKTGCYADLL